MKLKIIAMLLLSACAATHAQDVFWDKLQSASSTKDMIALCNQEISKSPEDYYIYFYRAMIKRESGDLDGALKDYNKVLSIEPRFSDAYIGRAKVRKELGDESGAKADLTKAKTVDHILDGLDERIEKNKLDAKAYLDRAHRKKMSRPPDYRGAVEDFEAYLRLTKGSPENSLPYIYLANCYRHLGLLRKAEDTLTRGIALFPDSGKLYQNRLGIRKEMGNTDAVREDELNLSRLAQANSREMIESFTKSLEQNPDSIFMLTSRAKHHIKLGELDAAQSDITHALSVDPKSRMAKRIQRDIDREKEKASNN